MSSDPRLEAIIEQLQRFASGDLAFRGEMSDGHDELDAIIVGLNMLADDFLVHQTRSRAVIQDMAELFERAPVMLFALDLASGSVLKANETMIERHGPAERDVVGTPLRDHVVPMAREAYAEALARVRAGSDIRDCELTLRCAQGGEYVGLLSATVVDDTHRRARCTLVDIEDRRQLESQLLQAQKMEAVGRLAGGVAHDFNNLLTVISNHTELARMSLPPDGEAAEDLAVVLDASAKAAALTGQLLAFSRRQIIRPKVLQLNELVEHTHRMLARLLGENVDVVLVLDPDCWPVRIDSGQFERILVNLAVNARDAMPNGGKLTIETENVSLDDEYARTHAEVVPGDYVMLAVTDNGEGMAEDVTAHVFEPFFTTKAAGSGTGLGLATCYGIVRQAGGHIWVYSELDRGTSFKIYLPRVRRPAESLPDDEDASATRGGGTETILVLEDDPRVRAITARILGTAGYTVLEASTGDEARAHFDVATVDLLVTDVVLSETTGRKVAESLRAVAPTLRVVYVSGYTDNSIVHHGVLDPGVDFLPKPFRVAQLLEIVRTALDRR